MSGAPGTPPVGTTPWGRSPLGYNIVDVIPEDPSIKAVWNKNTAEPEAAATRNSLKDIADDPPPSIPSSISDLKSEDGDKAPTPPTKMKHDPHRAFQQVPGQPNGSTASTSPNVNRGASTPPTHSTPRSAPQSVNGSRTPRQGPPMSLPMPPPGMNPPTRSYSVPYPPQLVAIHTPYPTGAQMVANQFPQGSSPMMPPPNGSMMPRGGAMASPQVVQQGTPMWGQPGPPPPNQVGYMRVPIQTAQVATMAYAPGIPGQPAMQLYMALPSSALPAPASPALVQATVHQVVRPAGGVSPAAQPISSPFLPHAHVQASSIPYIITPTALTAQTSPIPQPPLMQPQQRRGMPGYPPSPAPNYPRNWG